MRPLFLLGLLAALGCAGAPSSKPPAASSSSASSRYEDLVQLFKDWRAFQAPGLKDGVPDYSTTAMAAQYQGLAGMQKRLKAIAPTGWTPAQQADYHVVRADRKSVV